MLFLIFVRYLTNERTTIKMDSIPLVKKKEEAKLKRIAKKVAIKDAQEKQKNSIWRCRCSYYNCDCPKFEQFGKELCEDITKILSEKYGFNYNEAIALLNRC